MILNLSNTNISYEGMIMIFNGIQNNKSLKTIDLSSNVKSIQVIRDLKNIKYDDIEYSLSTNKTVEILILSNNICSSAFVNSISKGLENNMSIKELYMSSIINILLDCHINDNICIEFGYAICKHNIFKKLDISKNYISSNYLHDFLSVINLSPLEFLDISVYYLNYSVII